MFAVPGWNISAPIKAQTKAPPPATSPNAPTDDAEHAANGDAKASKKRKRGHGRSNGPAVSDTNVADLWEQYVEGKPAKRSKGEEEEVRRREKQREAGAASRKSKEQSDGQEKKDANIAHESLPKPAKPELPSKSQQKKKHRPDKMSRDTAVQPSTTSAPITSKPTQPPAVPESLPVAPIPLPPATKLTPLQASMRAKLAGARFRHLNETLYTTPSSHSLKLISEDPSIFEEYHAGFRQQVESWPENPVDVYIRVIRERGKLREQRGRFHDRRRGKGGDGPGAKEGGMPPLPRTGGVCRIADLGCGDARLASELQSSTPKLKLDIKSFDLASKSPLVTKADIASLPLADGSIDVAIFCLALMGTNWTDFIDEAYRVLRWKGELWVAEIKSRFGRVEGKKRKSGTGVVEHSVGKRRKGTKVPGKEDKRKQAEVEEAENEELAAVEVDGVESGRQETDVGAFVEVLRKRGFVLNSDGAVDLGNKMFVRMNFVKAAQPVKGKYVRAVEAKGDGDTWKKKPKGKIVDEAEEEVDESKVLKPCMYKLR